MVAALVKAEVVTSTMRDEAEPVSEEAAKAVDTILAKLGEVLAPLTWNNLNAEFEAWMDREKLSRDLAGPMLDGVDAALTMDQRVWLIEHRARRMIVLQGDA